MNFDRRRNLAPAQRPHWPRDAARRFAASKAGFTLLEVLTAMALSLLLISALYTALNMYWRYSTAGQDEAVQAQLARSLFRKMELDLRSVIYHAPSSQEGSSTGTTTSTTGGTTGGSSSSTTGQSTSGTGSGTTSGTSASSGTSSSGSTSQSSSSTSTTTPDDAVTSTNTGLFGNATTLMMHVSKPARVTGNAVVNGAETPTRMSDLVTVAYFRGGSGEGALQSAIAIPGLARMEGDRLAMEFADQESNLAGLAGQTELLAAEVVGLQFQYFDGLAWRGDWDSSVLGGLPRAVEILLEIAPPTGSLGGLGTKGIQSGPTIYRLVVALPAAKPMDSSQVE